MPLYDYTCTDGHRFEELVNSRDTSPISCIVEGCTCIANRSTVYSVTTIGPVFEHMEAYNSSLLSSAQRKAGVELRSAKDIRNMEEKLGLRRVCPQSTQGKRLLEQQVADHHDISQVKKREGVEASVDHVYKTEMTKTTGWTNGQYSNWKSTHDAAITAAKSGKVDLSATKRGAASKSPVRGT